MKMTHDNKHLSLEERKIIQTGIENRSSKVAIANTIGKDPSTVAKEIRKHRILKPRNTFNKNSICKHIKECQNGCQIRCERYEEMTCSERDRSPGACNKCENASHCHLNKYIYDAEKANKEYLSELSSSREGISLTEKERKTIGETIAPLLKQGQSVYQILSSHDRSILLSEKCLYNYIEMGVFKEFGVDNFSLKEVVNRKQFHNKYKKRKEPAVYDNHKYIDYQAFLSENPNVPTTEMDTVYNNPSGPYIQTFIFVNTGFMIGFVHHEKTSAAMASTLDGLQLDLGDELFSNLFSLLLTDRGPEFEKYNLFEINQQTGEVRLNIFYCDPMQSSQKPHVENNHNYLRDIIPNGMCLDRLSQNDLDLAFSHINSVPRKSLTGKTPYDVLCFFFGDKAPLALNISKIEKDKVVLKPYLLKHIYK